jgi:hypothetical protein
VIDWLKVCSSTGNEFIHSVEVEGKSTEILARVVLEVSQIIQINNRTDKKEIKDPKEEITFHVVKESG